jgi:uncharacterized SAM-binding protein YcdF (DUF218 family)
MTGTCIHNRPEVEAPGMPDVIVGFPSMTYTEPLITVVCAIAVLGLFRFRRRGGFWLTLLGVLGLVLISWPPVDWLLSRPLEIWYPVRAYPPAPAEAIVVLGSSVERPVFERPYPSPGDQIFHRAAFAAWLHKQWKPLPVLACGGSQETGMEPIAKTIRMLLEQAGVPGEKIWTEERSRSTHENAMFGAEVLRRHGVTAIALLVDASSMLRAEACFRKAGIAVVAAPSEFRELGPLRGELLPSWEAIRRNE